MATPQNVVLHVHSVDSYCLGRFFYADLKDGMQFISRPIAGIHRVGQ
jgi:hypothetical protein